MQQAPDVRSRRTASKQIISLIPAAVLLAGGFAVTFTQSLHNDLVFNRWVVAIFGVLFAFATFLPPLVERAGGIPVQVLAVGAASLLLGVAAPFAGSAAMLGLLILIWASVIAVMQVFRWTQSRERDALTIALFAALLAVILAVGARELPAITGFFAAYCIITGVYLGIASFDRATSGSAQQDSLTVENGS